VSSPKICPQCGAEYELDQRFCPKDGTTLRLQNANGDLVGAIIADRYHVLRKLGEGGMGQVYLAEHVKMGRQSALKVMNPAMVKDADAISRFNREAANASRINHPHVADVYDFGETPDGIIYLAMEFVDGQSLTTLLEHEGPFSPARVAAIVRQASDALAVAHEMGIVHRDLKPDNIMITRNRDGSDCVKIVDFGIAKAADNASQKVTKTGLVIGTPEYMSPEQLSGDKLDGRSDIYALALVAFNMLTGRLPFPADTVQESMIMRLTEAPRKLAEMRPDVAWSSDAQRVLDRALERDAKARYATANEFGQELAAALDGLRVEDTGLRVEGSGQRVEGEQPTLPVTRVAPPRSEAPHPTGVSDRSTTGRRRYTLAYAAGGVTLVAALIGAVMVMNRPTVNGDGVTPAGSPTSHVKALDTTQYSKAIASNVAQPEGGAGATKSVSTARSSADVARALDSLERVVSGDVTPNAAGRVIRSLEEMKSSIEGNEQLVHAAIIDALAESSRHDNAAACRALRRVEPIAPGTTRARVFANTLQLAC
jgi:serine/threonine-protein kinase